MNKSLSRIFILVGIFLNICIIADRIWALNVETTVPLPGQKGVTTTPTITITFNQAIKSTGTWTTVEDNIAINQIKNSLDETQITAINLGGWDNIYVDPADNRILVITPTLTFGITYEITVKTALQSTADTTLDQEFSFSFRTVWSSAGENHIVGSDGKTKLIIEANTLGSNGYVELVTAPQSGRYSATIAQADSAIIDPTNPLRYSLSGTMKGFELYLNDSSSAVYQGDLVLSPAATVTLPYDDSDNDGRVDQSSPEVLESSLSIYRLNINNNRWENIGGTVNTSNNTVTAQTSQLTVFVLMGSVFNNLNSAKAYPVPFKPTQNASHTHIIFSSLQPNSIIRIYSLSGDLVKVLNADANGTDIRWNARNSSGNKVVSGVYFYHIESPGDDKTGKLVIIR
ncbi:MAG: T9SS type A sorting domain-containing protein [Elusimicrobia bacterium]|nr:T9SS type A sorting domain-containing protein [Elusimicrobiota bacterium]MBD3411687.1 T9SS type A sorting domain-containing protein [Elusimicrobiota bacterium]